MAEEIKCEVCGENIKGEVWMECPDGLPGHEWLSCSDCHWKLMESDNG